MKRRSREKRPGLRIGLRTLFCLTLLSLALGRPLNAETPEQACLFDLDHRTFFEKVLIASIAGIVSREASEIVMVQNSRDPWHNMRFWVEQFQARYQKPRTTSCNDISALLAQYRHLFNGYVLLRDVAHLDNATSLAGVMSAVIAHPSTLHHMEASGLVRLTDAESWTTRQIYDTYRNDFNKTVMATFDQNQPHHLRDFAIMQKAFVIAERDSLFDYLSGQDDHSLLYGWHQSEFEFFHHASRANIMAVAANYLQSASALSQWQTDSPTQKHHTARDITPEEGRHYVSYVMSDGDNIQWLANGFATHEKWYGSPYRGQFPMTWDISPAVQKTLPMAFEYLYDQATANGRDYFICAHGIGTTYPSTVPNLAGNIHETATAMEESDLNVLAILDNQWSPRVFDVVLQRDEIIGAYFKSNWGAYKAMNGAIYWSNNKPVISAKYSLWDGFDSVETIVNGINSQPRDPFQNEQSFSVVNVHPWSEGLPLQKLAEITGRLDSHVKVVNLEELLILLKNSRQ